MSTAPSRTATTNTLLLAADASARAALHKHWHSGHVCTLKRVRTNSDDHVKLLLPLIVYAHHVLNHLLAFHHIELHTTCCFALHCSMLATMSKASAQATAVMPAQDLPDWWLALCTWPSGLHIAIGRACSSVQRCQERLLMLGLLDTTGDGCGGVPNGPLRPSNQ